MNSPVTIQLSQDEALVLLEFFARFAQDSTFRLRNNAEFIAFAKVSGQLDNSLAAPLQDDYVQQVEAARLRIAGEFQGIAPGGEPVGHA